MTKKHTLHGNAEPEFWHCQQFVRLKGSHFIQIGSSSKLQTSNCSNPQLQEKTFPRNTTSPFNAMAQPPVRNESIAVSCLRENKINNTGNTAPHADIIKSGTVTPLLATKILITTTLWKTQNLGRWEARWKLWQQHSWAYYYTTGILYYIIHTNSVCHFRVN